MKTDQSRLRKLGREAYGQQNFADAAQYYSELVGSQPDGTVEPEALADRKALATSLLKSGQLEAAAGHFIVLSEATPDDPAVFSKLGQILLRLGRLNPALGAFQRAADLSEHDADAHWVLAEALHAAGRDAAAMEAVENCLAINPDHALATDARKNWSQRELAVLPPSEAAFASLANFIQDRAAADSGQIYKPVQVDSYGPLIAVSAGSMAFLGLYLFVRLVVFG